MVTFGKAFAPGGAFGPQRLNELDPPLQTETLHGLFAGRSHPASGKTSLARSQRWPLANAKPCQGMQPSYPLCGQGQKGEILPGAGQSLEQAKPLPPGAPTNDPTR